ncbi:hypothetical protein D3C77_805540 [compost metagenome]
MGGYDIAEFMHNMGRESLLEALLNKAVFLPFACRFNDQSFAGQIGNGYLIFAG